VSSTEGKRYDKLPAASNVSIIWASNVHKTGVSARIKHKKMLYRTLKRHVTRKIHIFLAIVASLASISVSMVSYSSESENTALKIDLWDTKEL
jgi:hypothetical protein